MDRMTARLPPTVRPVNAGIARNGANKNGAARQELRRLNFNLPYIFGYCLVAVHGVSIGSPFMPGLVMVPVMLVAVTVPL